MTSLFADMDSSSKFFDLILLLFLSLVTGPSFMSISSLVLELWQFTFIRDWPEIWKSEIPPSELCPISGDWGQLGIPNIAQISLMNCYWVLQNARVTAFTVSELLRENQHGGGRVKLPPSPHTQIRVKVFSILHLFLVFLLLALNRQLFAGIVTINQARKRTWCQSRWFVMSIFFGLVEISESDKSENDDSHM